MTGSSREQVRETLRRYLAQHPDATLKQIANLLGVSRQRAHIRKQAILQPITDHELDILHYVQRGYTNMEIAEAVKRSHRTIKSQLNLIFAKLNTDNRNHAVALAIEQGLISLDKSN